MAKLFNDFYQFHSHIYSDFNSVQTVKMQADNVHNEQTTFSHLFYTISEQISNQMDWMLSDNLTDIFEFIDDNEHKRIITIDHILTVKSKSMLDILQIFG